LLIAAFGPVSGAHFSPAVSVVDWLLGRRERTGLTAPEALAYSAAQTLGAVAGAVLANIMFDTPAVSISTHHWVTTGHTIGEIVATAGLITLIFALVRARPAAPTAPLIGACVGAYIGAAYWFTSSTSFANPAVTIGRIFSNTFAGITPASAPIFIAAQIAGAAAGLVLLLTLFPRDRTIELALDRTAHQETSP
jgi:glycerol uptake facilitator-like aquaporin